MVVGMYKSWEKDLAAASVKELLTLYGGVLAELKRRGAVRTKNSPVSGCAENLVSQKFGLTLCGNSNAGYDATDAAGARYQIKARWLDSPSALRQLGVIRNLGETPFDYLIVVFFGPGFDVQEAYKMGIDTVAKYAQSRPHVNGHIILMSGSILSDPGVEDVTALFSGSMS